MMALRLCGVSILTACALVVVGCGGAQTGSVAVAKPMSLTELSQSASTSAKATSGRFAFDMSMSFPGAKEPFAFSGEGAFDAASKRAAFAVDMSSLAKLLGAFMTGLAGSGGQGTHNLPNFDDPAGWKI